MKDGIDEDEDRWYAVLAVQVAEMVVCGAAL